MINWFSSSKKKGEEKKEKKGRSFFSFPSTDLKPEREEELLTNLSKQVRDFGMETPAIMLLESIKPFSNIISQLGLLPVAPFLEFFGISGYDYAVLFMNKMNVERLVEKIGKENK